MAALTAIYGLGLWDGQLKLSCLLSGDQISARRPIYSSALLLSLIAVSTCR